MGYEQPTFSVNDYDSDGDIVQRGVFLWFGLMKIKVCDLSSDYGKFEAHIRNIGEELRECARYHPE